MASTDLVYRFLGIDAGAGASFDRMAGKTMGLGKVSGATTAALTKLTAAGVALVAVIDTEAVKSAANFQTALTRIHTQADASNATVARLRKGILDMTTAVATAPTQLATAAFHIASVGQKSLTAAQQLRILKTAAEGAKLGGADLVDVTNTLDAALVSHMRGVKNYSQAMGVLNATVGAGDMQMQDLADAFGPLGATFKGYNISLREAGAALATFGDNNLRGAEAGTALRMAVQSLAVPVKAGRDLLKSWGIHSGTLANQLRHGGLTDALDTLFRLLKKNGVTSREVGSFLTQTFGKRAGIGLSTLIGELGRFHTKLGEVGSGGHSFASSWAGYTKTFQYAFDRMRTTVEKFAIKIGTDLMPAATRFVNWLTGHFLPAAANLVTWVNHHILPALRGLGKILGGALMWSFRQIAGTVKNNLDGFKTLAHVLKVAGEATLWLAGQFGHILVGVLRTALAVVGETGKAFHALADFFTRLLPQGVGYFVRFWIRSLKYLADAAMSFFAFFVHAAVKALGWMPFGIGDAVKKGAAAFDLFRADIDSTLNKTLADTQGWGRSMAATMAGVVQSANAAAYAAANAAGPQPSKYETTAQAAAIAAGMGGGKGKYALPGGAGVPVPTPGSGSAKSAAAVLHVTARNLAKALATGLVKGWQGFALTVRESLSTGTQHLLEQLGKQFEAIQKRMTTLVENAKTKLHDALTNERSYVQQMMSDAGLGNVPTVDSGYTGQTTRLTSIGAFLGSQAKNYALFDRLLRRLGHSGLSKALVSQIAQMGPTQGIQYAQQILANPGQIAQINAYQKQIARSAKAIGQDQYGSQVAADRKNLRRQTQLQERMAHRLDHLARDIGREVAANVHPGKGGISGKPSGLSVHEAKQIERDLNKLDRLLGKKK